MAGIVDDKEFLPRLEVEELLERYAAGVRKFTLVDLSGADLSNIDFGYRELRGVTYNQRIDLSYSNLDGINLSGANLYDAIMELVNLTNACLERANLKLARLEGASLKGANLKGANLVSANLAGANLTDANLRGATWSFNSKDATFSNTILPDGTIRTDSD